MKALTAQEMREVDRLTTERYKISGAELMEAAGKHVADAVMRVCPQESRPPHSDFVWQGNNGGDGLVCARYLKQAGLDPRVWYFGSQPRMRRRCFGQFYRWQKDGGALTVIEDVPTWEHRFEAISRAQVLVDAMLGTGLRGAAERLLARVITDINRVTSNATGMKPALCLRLITPSGLPPTARQPVVQC